MNSGKAKLDKSMYYAGIYGIMYHIDASEVQEMKRMNTEQAQSKIDLAHGNNEYVLVEDYVTAKTKVLVRHQECGNEWKTRPQYLWSGHGCPKCAGNIRKTTSQFKDEIYELVGEEYSVLTSYKGNHEKVSFKHNTCEYVFEMEANSFLSGQRCPKCSFVIKANKNRVPLDVAQQRMDKATSNEYRIVDNYNGLHPRKGSKADLEHVTCGYVFKAHPGDIISLYSGCPQCAESKGEKYVAEFLTKHEIDFKRQFRFDDCRKERPLPFDFAIFENNELKCLIEYDGEQHFKPKFGMDSFIKTQESDKIKNEYCLNNNIHLIRIPYKRSTTRKSARTYIFDFLSNTLIPSQA